jgi:hypothetical protein
LIDRETYGIVGKARSVRARGDATMKKPLKETKTYIDIDSLDEIDFENPVIIDSLVKAYKVLLRITAPKDINNAKDSRHLLPQVQRGEREED